MSESTYKAVSSLLAQLESEIQGAGLWSSQQPTQQALQSALPFCCDTLHFHQWLQFIFIPKMRELMQNNQALPNAMQLLPMAEETLPLSNTKTLKAVIAQIDNYFSNNIVVGR